VKVGNGVSSVMASQARATIPADTEPSTSQSATNSGGSIRNQANAAAAPTVSGNGASSSHGRMRVSVGLPARAIRAPPRAVVEIHTDSM